MPDQDQNSDIVPATHPPSWWNKEHDDLLTSHLKGDSFFVLDVKEDISAIAGPTYDDFHYDLDFIISQTIRIASISPYEARSRILGDFWLQVDRNEYTDFDILCGDCHCSHNIYLNVKNYEHAGNALYGGIRTGCCGRHTALLLVVKPWRWILAQFEEKESETEDSDLESPSPKRRLREMFERRHDAFGEWNRLRGISLASKSYEISTRFRAQTSDAYSKMMNNGGTFLAEVSCFINPEHLQERRSGFRRSVTSSDDSTDGSKSPRSRMIQSREASSKEARASRVPEDLVDLEDD